MLEWSEACASQRPEDLGRVERVHVRRLRALQPQLSKLLDEKRIAQGGEQPAGAERSIRGVGEKASLEREGGMLIVLICGHQRQPRAIGGKQAHSEVDVARS